MRGVFGRGDDLAVERARVEVFDARGGGRGRGRDVVGSAARVRVRDRDGSTEGDDLGDESDGETGREEMGAPGLSLVVEGLRGGGERGLGIRLERADERVHAGVGTRGGAVDPLRGDAKLPGHPAALAREAKPRDNRRGIDEGDVRVEKDDRAGGRVATARDAAPIAVGLALG